jgi:hypothetical protein
VQQQIQLAVAKAVADVEARHKADTRQLVAGVEQLQQTVRYVQWREGEIEADRLRGQGRRALNEARQAQMAVNQESSGEVK